MSSQAWLANFTFTTIFISIKIYLSNFLSTSLTLAFTICVFLLTFYFFCCCHKFLSPSLFYNLKNFIINSKLLSLFIFFISTTFTHAIPTIFGSFIFCKKIRMSKFNFMTTRTFFPFSFFFKSIMPNNPFFFCLVCNNFRYFLSPNSR